MARKSGYDALHFEKVKEKEFDLYVSAVQKSAKADYKEMIEFIRSIFPD